MGMSHNHIQQSRKRSWGPFIMSEDGHFVRHSSHYGKCSKTPRDLLAQDKKYHMTNKPIKLQSS